jgi:hypothetical protein
MGTGREQIMDRFDEMSDHQVTWLDITSTFVLLAFILGILALVGLFAGSPHKGQEPLGSEGAVFDGPPAVAPEPATAEDAVVERYVADW